MSDEYGDDFDADGADDERTPLVNSNRLSRNRNGRRPGSASMRQMEYLEHRQRNCFSRYGGCVIASFLILILIGGAATFLAALLRPLLDVQVTKLSNVLAISHIDFKYGCQHICEESVRRQRQVLA